MHQRKVCFLYGYCFLTVECSKNAIVNPTVEVVSGVNSFSENGISQDQI